MELSFHVHLTYSQTYFKNHAVFTRCSKYVWPFFNTMQENVNIREDEYINNFQSTVVSCRFSS